MNPVSYESSTVLVIDDEEFILKPVQYILENAGFRVFSASEGETGIQIIRRENPKVVLTDINMPGLSGFDILKIIKKEAPLIQVVVFSGEGTTGDVIEALRLGAANYIYKPFDLNILVHTVTRSVERYDLLKSNIKRNEMLEKTVKERTAALRETFYATVKSLGRLLEMRDPYTSGHQNRVSKLAVGIGKHLSMSQQELEVLHVAGLLHDIGKGAVPSELLVKPSKLTAPEFQLIKCHPQSGYDVLKDISFMDSLGKDVAAIVMQHHEHMDGSGYPRKLKSGEISQEAKILAVADTFEAMSSHRPYRPAFDTETAKQELIEKKNILFSPECVDACMDLVETNDNNINKVLHSIS